jgi:hypothetical protein
VNDRAYVLAVIKARCADVLDDVDLEVVSAALGGELISIGGLAQVWQLISLLEQRIAALQAPPTADQRLSGGRS